MNIQRTKKRSLAFILLVAILPSPTCPTPLFTDTQSETEIGPEGGSLEAEDPATGTIFLVSFPVGALAEKTNIKMIIYGSPRPGVLGKTNINGIAILPEDLLLLEKASLSIYNPPGEVSNGMILYHIAGGQFIIPLGSQIINEDENWIEGTFYSTGKFSLGSPTVAEALAQTKKLAAYNPARTLAYAGEEFDTPAVFVPDMSDTYTFHASGGPYAIPGEWYRSLPSYTAFDPAECMRWQRALTKVEAHMTWVEHFIYTNNPAAEEAERAEARDALQQAIDGYLNRPSPDNRCSSYTRAAAKYTEAATLLGMNVENESLIARHFNKLMNECSYVFTVESRQWGGQPRGMDLGGMFESKLTIYSTINCHVPWNEFITSGNQSVQGKGNKNEHYEKHWVGDEEEEHEVYDNSYSSERIEGKIKILEDEFGRLYREAHITIYWEGTIKKHVWGKIRHKGSFDNSTNETGMIEESRIYYLDPPNNNWSEGSSVSGSSYRAIVIKQPGDGRYDPDDCF